VLSALVACASGSYNQRVEQIRAAFRHLEARQVLSCLGPPTDFEYPDEHRARWAYVHPLGDMAVSGRRGVDAGPGSARRRREFLLHPLDAAVVPGYCRLTVELVDNKVTDLRADARSAEGLNSDTACALIAAICFQ
jgi:hypothetical protein